MGLDGSVWGRLGWPGMRAGHGGRARWPGAVVGHGGRARWPGAVAGRGGRAQWPGIVALLVGLAGLVRLVGLVGWVDQRPLQDQNARWELDETDTRMTVKRWTHMPEAWPPSPHRFQCWHCRVARRQETTILGRPRDQH